MNVIYFIGKVGLVIGVGLGIGLVIVQGLVVQGIKVVFNDIFREKVELVVVDIWRIGGICMVFVGDVVDYEMIQVLIVYVV